MGGVAAVAPEVLDQLVRAEAAWSESQRRAMLRLQRAVEDLGEPHRDLMPMVAALVRDLRRVLTRAEELARHVAATAAAFRAADQLLQALNQTSPAPSSGAGGSLATKERGTVLPVPDVSIDWRWPDGWTVTRRWGDGRLGADVELGGGVRSGAGAGVDVTREAIRAGAFEELRIGAWAAAAVGSAIGPFAARASGEVFAGARGGLEGLLHVGRDGARAHVGGELFAGVKADGELRGSLGPVQAGAEGSVGYGAGVTSEADVDLTLRRVGGRVKLGAALGLGLDVGVEYYLEPAWLADGLVDLAGGALEVGATSVDIGSNLLAGAGGTVGDVVGAGGSAVRAVGGWFG
jgi:hypothetical protein